MRIQLRSIIMLLTVSVVLVGCSTQFGYRFADTFIEWQLAKYIDLSGPLEDDVDAAIDELHMWHARSELPLYRDALDELLAAIERKEVDARQLYDASEQLFFFWQRMRAQVTPYAQTFLPRLTAEQRDELLANLRERLADERKEASERTPEERFQRSYERMLDRADDWLGQVRPEQRRMLRRWLRERESNDELWLNYQEKWLAEFAEIIARPEAENFSQRLELLFTKPEQLRSPELLQQSQANRELAIAVLLVIYQSLTPQQEQHVKTKLRDYRATLTDLINEYAVGAD